MTGALKRCALLSCSDLTGFVCDDELLREPLRATGWESEFVSWDHPNVQWRDYDAVIIRATWDYTTRLADFLATLQRIEDSGVPLYNSSRLAKWNSRKTYLLDLEKKGIPIIPTRVLEGARDLDLGRLFSQLGSQELIVKPTVSANAKDTFRLSRRTAVHEQIWFRETLAETQILVQPFLRAILESGEISLHFFGSEFSHGIRKIPKAGDFRVQEEHGGKILSEKPSAKALQTAQQVIGALPEPTLYARVDLVESEKDFYQVMEVELIEPSLYFRTDSGAATRFARAFEKISAD